MNIANDNIIVFPVSGPPRRPLAWVPHTILGGCWVFAGFVLGSKVAFLVGWLG